MPIDGGVTMGTMPVDFLGEERRFSKEFRLSQTTDASPKIVGYASVFNQASDDLGGFKEIVKPGAFKKTIQESDIRALWNHDANCVLGRKANGTLTLEEDEHGLRISIDPPDTQMARDLMACIKRGDVDQMSFGFNTIRDTWDNTDPKNIIRYLDECRLFDVSPVTFPAYPQTSVSVRSKLESFAVATTEPPAEHSAGEPDKTVHSNGAEWRKVQELKLTTILEAK
jgi:HK97 family phage prohead protease